MRAGTPFSPDLLKYGHVVPNTSEQCKSSFESPGGSSAPSLVLNAIPTPQTGSLSLVDEQTCAPFMFLSVQFSDLAVYALVDSGQYTTSSQLLSYLSYETHPPLCRLFLATSGLPWQMGVWFRQLN